MRNYQSLVGNRYGKLVLEDNWNPPNQVNAVGFVNVIASELMLQQQVI